ncbi:MAG: hypothetical protein ACSHWY_03230 [Octadecabacter sp.]
MRSGTVGRLQVALVTALLCLTAPCVVAQTFDVDVTFRDGMRILGMDTLMDAPVGTPVYISGFGLCMVGGDMVAIGMTRLEPEDMPIGLLRVTRLANGSVEVEIPDTKEWYEDEFGTEDDLETFEDPYFEDDYVDMFEDETSLTLWTLLQTIPCADWGEMADDPSTLFPVATINGTTSMSELLATRPPAE